MVKALLDVEAQTHLTDNQDEKNAIYEFRQMQLDSKMRKVLEH